MTQQTSHDEITLDEVTGTKEINREITKAWNEALAKKKTVKLKLNGIQLLIPPNTTVSAVTFQYWAQKA